MRATLLFASLTLAAALVLGCEEEHHHSDKGHDSSWHNDNDGHHDAHPAGGHVYPYNNHDGDRD